MSDAALAAVTKPTGTRTASLLSPRLWVLILALGFVVACRFLIPIWLPIPAGDFELLYTAAGKLLRGESPYQLGGQPLPYPLPAVLLLVPFTAIPPSLARPIFDILVGWAFVYALWKYRGPYALLALFSGAYLFALVQGQTTPLMVAAGLIPALGFLLVVRPNTGVALWAARPSRMAFFGMAVFVALTVALFPSWLRDWWLALPVDDSAWTPPLLRPFGPLLLLGALRWNQPEGRLLLATVLLPQTTLPFELVPLALIPANRREMAIYLAGTWMAVAAATGVLRLPGGAEWLAGGWPVTLCAGYVPMLGLVLCRPGSKGVLWIGKERRRPHRLSDDELEIVVTRSDAGQVTVTVTHRPSQQSITQSASTRELAARKAHDKLAALLSRTSRLAKKDVTEL